ncbi:hypothetical protein PHLCEN_2v546 [Hermanssonia centrifuga]|uniref:Uncharacterized protein n=1 Tax=Hermanssonia centrifuga TaxID=98765 RepID=A0A2R6S5X8_9APHY|nr:hypothetical protein PHLCEN_2v546 [Hermanssonia centrifuga]
MDASIYSPDGQPGAPTVEPPLLKADCGGFGWCPLDDRDTMPEDLTSTSEFGSSDLLVLPLLGPTSCSSFELVEDDDPLDNPISLCQAVDSTCSEPPHSPLLLLVPDGIQYKDDDSLGGYSAPFRLSDLDSPLNIEYKSPVAPKSALDSFPTSPRNGSWLCSDSHPSFGMRVLEIQAAVVRLPQAVCGNNDAGWKNTWALAPPLLQSPTSQFVASNYAGFKDITIFEEPSPNTSPYVCLPRKPSSANIHPSPCILSDSPPCTTEAEDILCVPIDEPMDIISANPPVLSVGSTDETAAPSIFASSVGEQTVVSSSIASVAPDSAQNNIGKLPAQIKPASYATQLVKPSEPPKAKGLVHIISEGKASTVSPVTDVSKGESGPIYSLASGARLPPCYSWATAYTRRVDTLPGMRMVLARPPPLSPHQSSATCLDYHMEYQAKMLMPLHTELKDTRLNYGDNMRTTETAVPTPGWLPALVRVAFSKAGALWMGLGFGS